MRLFSPVCSYILLVSTAVRWISCVLSLLFQLPCLLVCCWVQFRVLTVAFKGLHLSLTEWLSFTEWIYPSMRSGREALMPLPLPLLQFTWQGNAREPSWWGSPKCGILGFILYSCFPPGQYFVRGQAPVVVFPTGFSWGCLLCFSLHLCLINAVLIEIFNYFFSFVSCFFPRRKKVGWNFS